MQRSSKRVITLLVVAVMLISFLSFVAPVAKAGDPVTVTITNIGEQGNVNFDVLAKHGVLPLPGNTGFLPDKNVTRAEFAIMLGRSFPLDVIPRMNTNHGFKDLSPVVPASSYVGALKMLGVVSGYSDGTFRPDAAITREEAITMLLRAVGVKDPIVIESEVAKYKDFADVSSWAKGYVTYATSKGILIVYSDGTLKPKASLTTTQIASIIVNARFPTVTILHTNDFHMYLLGSTDKTTKKPIGGSARIYTLVERERAYNPRTLLVDAGDIIGGGPPIGAFFYGKDVIEVYNAMGYDIATTGNHEFDWGYAKFKEITAPADYEYINANIVDSNTNKTILPPYSIKSFGFVDVGFIGVVTTDLPVLVNPKGIEGLAILDPTTTINNYATSLKDKVEYTLVLSHLGYDVDKTVAAKISNVNLIIGGHSHTVLTKPDVVNGIPIVQTGSYGNNIGKVVLEFQTTANSTKLLNMNYTLIPINDSIPEDPTIKGIIDPYNTQLKAKMDEAIGEALVDLNGNRPDIRIKETNLGDFVADWMKAVSGADIAITNGGGIRASIPKGPITVGSIYTILPFDNLLVKIEITGKQVIDALENGFSQVEAIAGRFPQISGITVKVNLSKPAGSRVIEVLVGGKPIDPDKLYTVVTNDFMAAGGDGYAVFKEAAKGVGYGYGKLVTGNWMRDDLVEYIKAHPEVNVTIDGRITFVNP